MLVADEEAEDARRPSHEHVGAAPDEQAEREADEVDNRHGERVARGPQRTAERSHRDEAH